MWILPMELMCAGLLVYIIGNICLAFYRVWNPYKIKKCGNNYHVMETRYKYFNAQDFYTYWKVIATLHSHDEAKRHIKILRGKK